MKNMITPTHSRRAWLLCVSCIGISFAITGYPVAIQSIQAMIDGAEVIVLGDIVNTLEAGRAGGQEVVFQQDAVLQGLMPPLDFALDLRMIWRSSDMAHVLVT